MVPIYIRCWQPDRIRQWRTLVPDPSGNRTTSEDLGDVSSVHCILNTVERATRRRWISVADVELSPKLLLFILFPQDGAGGAAWLCNLLHGMDLPCYTHTFYEVPAAKSGLRAR